MSTVNTIYYCNNGCIQIPEGWEDKTIISLTYPAGAKQATASFTIVKDTLKDNEITLAAYVDNHLQAVKEFSNFRLLEHNNLLINRIKSEQVEFKWDTPDGDTIHQKQTIVYDFPSIYTLTATANEDHYVSLQSMFEIMIQSFKPSKQND